MPDPNAVNSMFGRIARRYDSANRLLSFGVDRGWRRRLVRAVSRSQPRNVADMATGSGDVAFSLAEALPTETEIIGMDFCQPMLDEALKKKKLSDKFEKVIFQLGDGMNIPAPDDVFDAVTVSFGLRNMADRHQALQEMHRVLSKPNGRLFLLEFSQPARWFRPFYYFYLKRILPSFASAVTGDRSAYEYLCGSIEQFPTREELTKEIKCAGFSLVQATPLTFGIVALHEARV